MRQFTILFLGFALLWHLLFVSLFVVLWGTPTLDSWSSLYTITFADLPLAFWISFSILIASFLFFLIARQSTHQLDRSVQIGLVSLYEGDGFPKRLESQFSRRLNESFERTAHLLATQRKTLTRISEEKADSQAKLIQERVVEERQRLARELHDSVSQQLFGASMLASSMVELEASSPRSMEQLERAIHQAQLEMRALLLHLRPAGLHDRTLAEGLEELLEELQQKVQLKLKWHLDAVKLTKASEDHLFRIAQETLSNTLRHAQATEMEVRLMEQPQLVIFRVQDNGIGFDSTQLKPGAYGLGNVYERAVEMGATAKIVSVPNQGTFVEIQVPKRQEEVQ
ncbi:sensor histidine kinase [Chryseomicrobium sp. FSL W7-1435]|uniref:sensor histidine kinase n=1 Tax=Chryseomicrobium sp. FSL W7-1435 TaxID=2921704 RepID=UPI003159B982